MKKTFWLLIAVMTLSLGIQAQTLQQGEPAIVYYSPKNYVVLDFSYVVKTQEKGIYADYAEELLGIDNIVEENKKTYELKNVRISTRTEADKSRPHKVVAEQNVPIQLLRLNDKSILVGYNLPEEEKRGFGPRKNTEEERVRSRITTMCIAPYTEEVLETKTLADEAKAVAKQIFRIRESRMYLLSGEVEHAPADGTAMKLVLDELNKQEQQLTDLFTGKSTHETKHKIVSYLPMAEDGKNFHKKLYFSQELGFTTAENAEAEAIGVTIQHTSPQLAVPTEEVKSNKKGSEQASQIVYNLPGQGEVTVRYKGETFAERTLPLAQFGVDVPLARTLFTGKTLPVIRFNEKTGNIISISK